MRLEGLGLLAFWIPVALVGPWSAATLVTAYAAFAFSWSSLQWVYHLRTPLHVVEGGYNLRLPAPLRWLWLSFNMNLTHHRRPYLPWQELYAASNQAETQPLWYRWLLMFVPPARFPTTSRTSRSATSDGRPHGARLAPRGLRRLPRALARHAAARAAAARARRPERALRGALARARPDPIAQARPRLAALARDTSVVFVRGYLGNYMRGNLVPACRALRAAGVDTFIARTGAGATVAANARRLHASSSALTTAGAWCWPVTRRAASSACSCWPTRPRSRRARAPCSCRRRHAGPRACSRACCSTRTPARSRRGAAGPSACSAWACACSARARGASS